MDFVSRYLSHKPDPNGYITYSDEEHKVWQILYDRQSKIMPGRACIEHIEGLEKLGLSREHIPQLPDVSKGLKRLTGWQVQAVEALISARDFFELLADKKFPAATFIRVIEELDYVTEPDIFHELFGHCPMLTNQVYADFVHEYACTVLSLPEDDWPLLQRLFWFTVEFGLITTKAGLRAYGGGILSSIGETPHSVESRESMRVLFDPVVVLRTPYRIDQIQPIYFVIDSYNVLYDFVKSDIKKHLAHARKLGEYPPLFKVDENDPNIHILAC